MTSDDAIRAASERLIRAQETGEPCAPVRDLIGTDDLDPEAIEFTVGTLLKYREDQERARTRGFGEILSAVLGA